MFKLLIVECTEVDEAGDHHDHLHEMRRTGAVVGHHAARGEMAPEDAESREATVLVHPTAFFRAKSVSEVLWIVNLHEISAGWLLLMVL